MDHAQEGFSLQGKILTDLNITATEKGKASAAGVDITYSLAEDVPQNAAGYTSSRIEGGERKSDGGRLKTSIIIPRSMNGLNPYFNESSIESTMYDFETVLMKLSYMAYPMKEPSI